MAVGILVMLIWNNPVLPEINSPSSLKNTSPEGNPIFPMMFVSIACGAISGFHATQSPMMARCMKNEKHGRPVFYGAMIIEGIVALIWAAAASAFFYENGMEENNAAVIVDTITKDWLGIAGAILALLGVIFAPITSGDTAFRSARLIVADILKIPQKKIYKRLLISIPLFIASFLILQINFDILWRYFAWCNQTLAVFTLWTITVYLTKEKSNYIITLIPALFMTMVCVTYIFIAPEGFSLSPTISYTVGGVATIISLILYIIWNKSINFAHKGNL
jgi:carbon starvation protein CstA